MVAGTSERVPGGGWTGGQYSLLRALLGTTTFGVAVYLLATGSLAGRPGGSGGAAVEWLAQPGVAPGLGAAAAALGLLLAAGSHDRAAAVGLWAVGLTLLLADLELWSLGAVWVGWVLLLHAVVPAAPYGSWAARGRPDPGAGWRMPRAVAVTTWGALAAANAVTGGGRLAGAGWVPGGTAGLAWGLAALAELFLAGLLAAAPLRPAVWALALGVELPILIAAGEVWAAAGLALLHLVAADPAWVPPRWPERRERLFYDGGCGLCHRAVRFVLAEDRRGAAFRFAPLGGETFRAEVAAADREELPDSIVVRTADGRLLTRSAAVLHLGRRLGGAWRLAAAAAALLPRPLRDRAYDAVARFRYRLFARPPEACPVLSPALRQRFDP